MSISNKSKQIEEQYKNRKLSLDKYRDLYKKETNDTDEIRVRQSYNRYKSITISKPSISSTFDGYNIPKDVGNIILTKSSKYKTYNKSSYYDTSRLEDVKKKCERSITLLELNSLQKDLKEKNKEVIELFNNNRFIVYPIGSYNKTRVFSVDSNSNRIFSEIEINQQIVNNGSYSFNVILVESTKEISLQSYTRSLNNFRYSGSVVPLPIYRYFLKKRTLCFNLLDSNYLDIHLQKLVENNVNDLLKEINILFDVSYNALLTLDYNEYYITSEFVTMIISEYDDSLEILLFLENILRSLISIIYFFYVIGIFDFEDRLEEDKLGFIYNINHMSGDFEELLNLVNLHFYSIVFGLRTAIDRNLYISTSINNGLVPISELKEGFYEYLNERNEYYSNIE